MTIATPWLRDQPALGIFEGSTTFGNDDNTCPVRFDPATQHYSVEMNVVEAMFLWKRVEGDFILRARANVEAGDHTVWGLVLRTDVDGDVVDVGTFVDNESISLRTNGDEVTRSDVSDHLTISDCVVQFERTGNLFGAKVARFGEPFGAAVTHEVVLEGPVYVGLMVAGSNARIRFTNVRIVVPATDTNSPRANPLGSHLEILDLESGDCQIIHSSSTPFEAPNWTPDGQALIFNSQGRLYRFDLGDGTTSVIDTGFATRNNNDHVLSFDGSMLGISDHTEEGHSVVYVVPVEGGTPRRVTPRGPSYLHGWSPDGKDVVYTGARDSEYDIYRMSIEGGEETRLTTAVGLDDGPEYTPEGRYIYFNSVRSGTMQIWRMAVDGSDQEQMTDDEFNNWFPHVSPDGQEIVFLSYMSDVVPSAHPPYKHVYLRRMPIDGGKPTVVAYVYGGQGTINVPSWSPDGRHLAFVSNSATL